MDYDYLIKALTVLQGNPDTWLMTEQVFRKSGLFDRDGYNSVNYDKVFRALKYWVKLNQCEERKITGAWEFKYLPFKQRIIKCYETIITDNK